MRRRRDPAFDASEHVFGRRHKRVRAWDVPGIVDTGDDPGSEDGPPVFVLVHGLGVSSDLFRAVTDRLRHLGRVVVFDLPGFGGVPHPRDPLSIPEFARGIDAALQELGVVRPVLVGHSMGAQVVVELARLNPAWRGRMVLVGPVLHVRQRTLPSAGAAFVRSAVHERPGSALVSVRGYLTAGLRWPLELLPSMLRYKIEDRIADLGGRLVIVHGEHDRLCPAAWAERLLNRSGAEGSVVMVEGAAHQVVVDHADVVAVAAVAAAGRAPLP